MNSNNDIICLVSKGKAINAYTRLRKAERPPTG